MPLSYSTIRIETLLALALSKRWPGGEGNAASEDLRNDPGARSGSEVDDGARARAESNGLAAPLQNLGASDRRAVAALLRRYEKLSPEDQSRWLAHRLSRIQASTPERNVRFDKNIHPSQIIESLRDESPRIQSLVIGLLSSSQLEPVANALGLASLTNAKPPLDHASEPKITEVVRRAFVARFVGGEELNNPSPLDLLSGVELARLIRLLGVRETAIACQGISAIETVTAFLRRFSAEDAHAIVSHLSALQKVESERIALAEQLARKAISAESDASSAMLDRVGLSLLAIVLQTRGTLRRRHTAQKLPIAAARELDELMNGSRIYCERELTRRIAEEAESLAANLHHAPLESGGDRRGYPAV